MGVTIGPVPPERADEYLDVAGGAFGFDHDEGDTSRFSRYYEWDRARAAYDGERMVGTAGAYSLEMTVPGSTMSCGGTTVVSVLPTHRRRGILRMMLDSHFEDVRERGEPIAGLWASESSIYGRFGYGIAARDAEIEVRRDHGGFHRLAAPQAPVRLIGREEATKLLPDFYDSVRHRHPGFFARSRAWWNDRRLHDPPDDRDGATAFRFAVTEENGHVTGFVQYRYKEQWTDGHGAGEVRITELLAGGPESWSGLWHFVLEHDLTATIKASHRSIDDPIFGLLAAPRRARTTVDDSLWIRIMDIPAALEGRSYAANAAVVVSVHDPVDASLTTWRLDVSPEGAEISASDEAPDVELDLSDLSACFMGWSRFQDMAAAGRIAGDHRFLRELDAAFDWFPSPWCPEVF